MDFGLCFQHPCNIIIAGPTGCGKTHFVTEILKYRLIDPMPTRMILLYEEPQPMYAQWKQWFPNFEMVRGWVPDIAERFDGNVKNLLILDDQMSVAGDDKELSRLFTIASHHRNVTIIYLVQNLFDKGKAMRDASLNARYLVLFKNGRDRMQLVNLGKQIFDGMPSIIPKALDMIARQSKHPYVVIWTHPQILDILKIHTGIFPGEEKTFYTPGVYKDKKGRGYETETLAECRVVNLLEL